MIFWTLFLAACTFTQSNVSEQHYALLLLIWVVIGLAIDGVCYRRSKQQLLRHFRALAATPTGKPA